MHQPHCVHCIDFGVQFRFQIGMQSIVLSNVSEEMRPGEHDIISVVQKQQILYTRKLQFYQSQLANSALYAHSVSIIFLSLTE